MSYPCIPDENAFQVHSTQKRTKKYFKNAHFLMLCNSSASFVLNYDKVVFKSFNSGSIDVRTQIVLSVVWKLSAFKDNC